MNHNRAGVTKEEVQRNPDLIGQPEFAGEKTGCKTSNSWHVSMQDRLIQLDTADFDDFQQRTLLFSCDESMKAGFWLQS